ncbi:Crp/Fnr family transcriptional regulator [Paenibacillus tianjinensis]|uniref:Crp/Fnr family transcriptional regulator n=1 Tax=Paenibacillus tianjinensis TaxID=2810347 RepID=A0ABX7L8Y5_9BACL|nr:Crp/Fnr family transcriptional regulator [Paenibacillus tianjinensis]QSF44619.1 Crp/Fnr family transcriptional regulator [Paenibacillus tianjinensis]
MSDHDLHIVESIIESNYYTKGNLVFREGEQSESLFIVNNGLIKLTQNNKEGKQHVLRFLFPGDYFGQFALLHNKRHYATAEVVEGGLVCRMHRKDFLPLIEKNTALAFSFLMSMSEQLQQADELAGSLHILEAEKRLARLLLHLSSKNKQEYGTEPVWSQIHLPAAKKDFAAMIGTTPETLSRKLNKLETMKIIEVSKRTVVILDVKALYQIAEY